MSDMPRYDATTLCAVAGVKPVTWRAWRNRLGFLNDVEVKESTSPQGVRSLYSPIDIMLARMVVDLTSLGIPAAHATWFAESHVPVFFENWLDPENDLETVTTVVAVRFGGDEKPLMSMHRNADPIGSVFESDGRPAAIVSIPQIAIEVFEGLKELGYPAFATREETRKIAIEALIRGLRGDDEETADD